MTDSDLQENETVKALFWILTILSFPLIVKVKSFKTYFSSYARETDWNLISPFETQPFLSGVSNISHSFPIILHCSL